MSTLSTGSTDRVFRFRVGRGGTNRGRTRSRRRRNPTTDNRRGRTRLTASRWGYVRWFVRVVVLCRRSPIPSGCSPTGRYDSPVRVSALSSADPSLSDPAEATNRLGDRGILVVVSTRRVRRPEFLTGVLGGDRRGSATALGSPVDLSSASTVSVGVPVPRFRIVRTATAASASPTAAVTVVLSVFTGPPIRVERNKLYYRLGRILFGHGGRDRSTASSRPRTGSATSVRRARSNGATISAPTG